AKKGEAALKKRLGRDIPVHVRSLDDLRRMVKADPYKRVREESDAKRVITFIDAGTKPAMKLPFRKDGSAILTIKDGVAYTVYAQNPKGAAFMAVLEKAFGKKITTRTWDMINRLCKR